MALYVVGVVQRCVNELVCQTTHTHAQAAPLRADGFDEGVRCTTVINALHCSPVLYSAQEWDEGTPPKQARHLAPAGSEKAAATEHLPNEWKKSLKAGP